MRNFALLKILKITRGIFWGNFTQLCDFSELVFNQRAALKSLGTPDLKSWFLCSLNNKRQAFSVWTIHEGYFDIKRIAVWDFWQLFFNFQLTFWTFHFFPKIKTKRNISDQNHRTQPSWQPIAWRRVRRALCWQTNATYDVIWRKMGFWLMRET